MKRNVSTGIALAICCVTVACGGNAPTPASVTTGEMKGNYGVFYYVSVSRPVGGTIRSTDDKINCGTAGGPNNLCAPARYSWSETASLTAIPDNTGLYFQSWAGDCSGSLAAGCSLDTIASGADKWVAAVFNPADRLGHTSIPNPGQHGPLFFSFIKKTAGTPRCNTCHGVNYDGLANAPSCTACHAQVGHGNWLTDCSFCHGNPPASHAVTSTNCSQCHPDTVNAAGTIIVGGKHMNGAVDVAGCNSCHGFPPANGAHLTHFGLTPAEGTSGYGDLSILETRFPDSTTAPAKYAFGCGNCHPLDSARHMDGTLQVELYNSAATAGSLKALNPLGPGLGGASYTDGPNTFQGSVKPYTDGTCSNVYCHSSGQETTLTSSPAYVITPAWTSTAKIACNGCHANPPKYPSGGAGTATANTHVVAGDDGWALGHFAGFHGPWGSSSHGRNASWGSDAAPITCQTCHFDTVDPANTGPTGFYYLDTTGNYEVYYTPTTPAGSPPRLATLYDACQNCHTGLAGGAPTGTGRILPLRHVNGKRDVVFDTRSLPGPILNYPGAPASTNLQPYWYSNLYYGEPASLYNGAVFENGSWSVHLKNASYASATKTCTNVACHLQESNTSFPALAPLRWGTTPVGNATCDNCHGYGRP